MVRLHSYKATVPIRLGPWIRLGTSLISRITTNLYSLWDGVTGLESNSGCTWLCPWPQGVPWSCSCKEGDRREDSRDTSVPTLLQNSVPIPQMKAHPLSWPLNKCCIIYRARLQALHLSHQNHLAILHITARGSEPETHETDLSQHITIFTQIKHSTSLPNYSCHSHACPHSMANTGASGKHWVPVKQTLVRFKVVVGPYARSHWGSGTREMESEAPLGASGWVKGSEVNRVTQSADSWSTTEKRILPIG